MNEILIFTFFILGIGGTILIPLTLYYLFSNNIKGYRDRLNGSSKVLKQDIFIYLLFLYAIVIVLVFL